MTAYDPKLTAELLRNAGTSREKLKKQLFAASEHVEQLERALTSIERYYATEFHESEKAYQAVIIARAALAGEDAT